MANLNGVITKKGVISSSLELGNDAISGLIIGGLSTSKLPLNTAATINNLAGASQLGLDEAYDEDNKLVAYRHISEFYRMKGEGTELHIMLVDRTKSIEYICTDNAMAKALLVHADGEVRQLGIAQNQENVTMVNGIPFNVLGGIQYAQELHEWSYDNNMPTQVLLEGYAFGGNASSSQGLRNISNVEAPKVSIMIGQDYDYAEGLDVSNQKYADVGTLLGVTAKAKVNQNVGNNELFNLSSVEWVTPGLSNHQTNKVAFAQLQTLEDKGYIFGVKYTGLQGVRFNNDHTCVEIKADADGNLNESSIAYGRTNDKAVRGLRQVYLPKIKTDWEVDSKTGYLSPATVVALESLGDKFFGQMIKNKEISYGKTTIDKTSDLLGKKELLVSYVIVPKGSIGEIKGTINIKRQV